MKVLILAHGTRGDVQPYAALALALQQAGHEAVLAAPAASAALVEPYGLRFTGVRDGPNTLVDDLQIREAIETNYRGVRGKRIALEVMRRSKPLMARVFADMLAAAGLPHHVRIVQGAQQLHLPLSAAQSVGRGCADGDHLHHQGLTITSYELHRLLAHHRAAA